MSRSIELSDEVYAALEATASAAGVTLAEWVAQRVNGTCSHESPQPEVPLEVLEERFRARVGAVRSGEGEGLSVRHSEVFGDMLEEEYRDGRFQRMSRSLEVSDRAYSALEAAAAAEGMTPREWLDAHLPDVLANAAPATDTVSTEAGASRPRTLADRLVGMVGTVHSGRSDLSERHSELFAEGMLEKQRMGTL